MRDGQKFDAIGRGLIRGHWYNAAVKVTGTDMGKVLFLMTGRDWNAAATARF